MTNSHWPRWLHFIPFSIRASSFILVSQESTCFDPLPFSPVLPSPTSPSTTTFIHELTFTRQPGSLILPATFFWKYQCISIFTAHTTPHHHIHFTQPDRVTTIEPLSIENIVCLLLHHAQLDSHFLATLRTRCAFFLITLHPEPPLHCCAPLSSQPLLTSRVLPGCDSTSYHST